MIYRLGGAFGTSVVIFIIGITLRMNTHAIAWKTWPPPGTNIWGDLNNSEWAIRERGLTDVSYFLMALGVLCFAITWHHLLNIDNKSRNSLV
jgi:hypothetical protein